MDIRNPDVFKYTFKCVNNFENGENVKKFHILAIIYIFSFFTILPSFAQEEEGLIWNYRSDKFLESLKDGQGIYDNETQKDLDNQIREGLDINLLPVDLKTCIYVALKNNYDIKIAETQKEEAKWNYARASADLLPDFYYRYQIQALHGEFLVGDILPRVISQNPVYSGFRLDYPLGNGYTLFTMASKNNLYKSQKHNIKYTQSEILLNTTIYYYELLESKLNIEVLISNLRDRHEQLKLMQARYHIGIGTKYDILRADAQYADAKQELIEELNVLRLKQAQLANIMGLEVTLTLYPYEHGAYPRELIQKQNTISGLYNIALQVREDVQAKRAEIRSLVNLKNRNYTDFAPYVTFSYEYGRVGTTESPRLLPNHTVSFNVAVPLGNRMGLGTLTQKNADLAKIKTARFELTNLERNIKESIVSSYYSSKTALERIEANKKQVAAADEGLKFSLVGFDVGQNTFIDVLTSQTEKTKARQQLIRSIIAYNKAQAKLLFDIGIISPKSLLLNYKGMDMDTP